MGTAIETRIKYLQKKVDSKLTHEEVETKYRKDFEKYAGYKGNGIYHWKGVDATDTAILFLTVVCYQENIQIKEY